MGLDWNPIGKPKPGFEAEFERLFASLETRKQNLPWLEKVKRIFRPVDLKATTRRLDEIQLSPYQTVAAPCVGRDGAADEWVRRQFRENPVDGKTETEVLREMAGYYVLPLAPPCDGIPFYSNGPAGYVELFSFRAQFIVNDCREIVGEALLEDCYRSCFAPGLKTLGARLRRSAEEFATQHGVTDAGMQRESNAEEGTPEANAHILYSAAKWCEYWSTRGHGMEAYF